MDELNGVNESSNQTNNSRLNIAPPPPLLCSVDTSESCANNAARIIIDDEGDLHRTPVTVKSGGVYPIFPEQRVDHRLQDNQSVNRQAMNA